MTESDPTGTDGGTRYRTSTLDKGHVLESTSFLQDPTGSVSAGDRRLNHVLKVDEGPESHLRNVPRGTRVRPVGRPQLPLGEDSGKGVKEGEGRGGGRDKVRLVGSTQLGTEV